MLRVEDALERIMAEVVQMPVRRVSLADSHGRVLAADVVSPRDIPPWDNSAMDGYAVVASDTEEGEATLVINEVVRAGAVPSVVVTPGTATVIMTGAPMPQGADAVVLMEESDQARSGEVRLFQRVTPGRFVRRRGGDVRKAEVVLSAGRRLDPASVGLAASMGFAELSVRKRPVVTLLSTGDEVVSPGQSLGPGQIYSSNVHALAGLVEQAGAVAHDAGNAPDDVQSLTRHISRCADGDTDVVVTTGGVSVGDFDFVKEAFAAVGIEMDFWKVAMKPGKPLAFGVLVRDGRKIPVFGLPGNPVSCMVNFLQFVRPWLLRSMGVSGAFLPVITAIAADDFRSRSGKARLERVVLEVGGEGIRCRSTGSQSSGVLTSMVRASGLLLIAPEDEGPTEGDVVRVQVVDLWSLHGTDPAYGW